MLEIKINRLTLENFKCHRHLNLDLPMSFGGTLGKLMDYVSRSVYPAVIHS